jgi:hypothetical protein
LQGCGLSVLPFKALEVNKAGDSTAIGRKVAYLFACAEPSGDSIDHLVGKLISSHSSLALEDEDKLPAELFVFPPSRMVVPIESLEEFIERRLGQAWLRSVCQL